MSSQQQTSPEKQTRLGIWIASTKERCLCMTTIKQCTQAALFIYMLDTGMQSDHKEILLQTTVEAKSLLVDTPLMEPITPKTVKAMALQPASLAAG